MIFGVLSLKDHSARFLLPDLSLDGHLNGGNSVRDFFVLIAGEDLKVSALCCWYIHSRTDPHIFKDFELLLTRAKLSVK